MVTLLKAAANAANAKLSTGPRTDEGKATSSRNSLKHGLTSRQVVAEPGREPEFNEFLAAMQNEFRPEGIAETNAFNRLVHAEWNLRRLREMESAMMREGILDPLLDESETALLDRIYRYYPMFERLYARALAELRTLQTNRTLRAAVPVEIAEHIPALVSLNDLTKRTQTARRAIAQEIEDCLTAPALAPAAVQNEPTAGHAAVDSAQLVA
jgi:hypothetical protein